MKCCKCMFEMDSFQVVECPRHDWNQFFDVCAEQKSPIDS